MAGNYPDVPAPRLAYDREGSVLVQELSGGVTQLAQSSLENINSDNNSSIYSTYANSIPPRKFIVIFPEQRDIRGFFSAIRASWTSCQIHTSINSTNGLDGNWIFRTTVPDRTSVVPAYRTSISTVDWPGVKAVKIGWFSTSGSAQRADFLALHLYGTLSEYAGNDKLRIWHPDLDEPLDDLSSEDGAWFDFGTTVRGTWGERRFRIKNNSSTLTANDISVSLGTLNNTSPTLLQQFVFSIGGSFSYSLNIGSLAPGEISDDIIVRRITSINAATSVWTIRIMCDPASWS